jgi:hypothetical protein|tara:strand:- start:262 stop:636 length:375 start_codon:yes stop_codon:yes gene_type:complete
MDEQVKIAIIEQKIEDLKPIILKLDATIEKLSEVNTTVSRMLAVHEERISKSEEIDSVLFAKIDELRDKMDADHHSVLSRLQGLERKVWTGIGIVAAITFLMNNPWVELNRPTNTDTIVVSYSR